MRRVIATGALLALAGGLLPGCATGETTALTGTTWYLVSGSEANPAWQWSVPPDAQSRYTVRFEGDSTFASRADCNQVAGSWAAAGSDRITITPGLTTLASCGELSLDVLYTGLLRQASRWQVASTGMTLTLADGGRLEYTSVAPAVQPPSTAPTEEPAGSATPSVAPSPEVTTKTATATTTATATVTATATATVTATPPTAPTTTAKSTPRPTAKPTSSPTTEPTSGLTGRAWQLDAFTLMEPSFSGTVPAAEGSKYTIEFSDDGTFSAQADCNRAGGTYSPVSPTGPGGSLSVALGPVTAAGCPEGSYGDLYLTAIAGTAGFSLDGDGLTLTLADSGTLQYR